MNTKLWATGLRVPVYEAGLIHEQGWTRLLCTFNAKVTKSTSLTPWNGGHYLILNQQILKATGGVAGASMQVEVEPDLSEHGMEMPASMREVQSQDPEADHLFHELSPGKQRSLIHLVRQVRSTDIQIRKALTIVEHLKGNEGRLDFKLLHQQLKL